MSIVEIRIKAGRRLAECERRVNEITAQINTAVNGGALSWAEYLKENLKRAKVILCRQQKICEEISNMQVDIEEVSGVKTDVVGEFFPVQPKTPGRKS